MKKMVKSLLALAVTAAVALPATAALANVAANTQIINQAQLSYNDGTANKTATASVTVTVALVPSSATVTPGPDQSGSYNGPATKLTNSFIVTASANGPDTYNVSTNITTSTNTTNPTATATTTSVALGASITLTGSTNQIIVVPADGVNDGKVNGIQVGSTVVINGEARQVQSVTDNASGTSTIVLSSVLTKGAPGAGVLVAEQKTVTVDVTAGTITATGTDITVQKTLTVTSVTSSSASVTSSAMKDTFTSGVASLSKYVRNLTTPSGTGTPYVYNSTNYYAAGVTAKPGDVLEYILVASNSGSGAVTGSVVTDLLPTTYLTMKANTYGAGKEITYVNDSNVTTTYSAAADSDAATYVAGTGSLTVNVGTGATSSAGGSIPGGNKSVLVLYQATVNP